MAKTTLQVKNLLKFSVISSRYTLKFLKLTGKKCRCTRIFRCHYELHNTTPKRLEIAWVIPASGWAEPIRRTASAPGPDCTSWLMREDGGARRVPQGDFILDENSQ